MTAGGAAPAALWRSLDSCSLVLGRRGSSHAYRTVRLPAASQCRSSLSLNLFPAVRRVRPAGGGGTPSGSRSRPVADPHFVGYTYKNWEAVDAAATGKQRVREPPARASMNELHDAFAAVELGGPR